MTLMASQRKLPGKLLGRLPPGGKLALQSLVGAIDFGRSDP
jgi:hypothetical protein